MELFVFFVELGTEKLPSLPSFTELFSFSGRAIKRRVKGNESNGFSYFDLLGCCCADFRFSFTIKIAHSQVAQL